jgi:glutaredoxin 3
MPNVVLYSTAHCPFCVRARRLLDAKGVDYTDIRVDLERDQRQVMEERSGRTSVPQIFIDEYHVGGFDDMVELDIDGDLDRLLGLATDEG